MTRGRIKIKSKTEVYSQHKQLQHSLRLDKAKYSRFKLLRMAQTFKLIHITSYLVADNYLHLKMTQNHMENTIDTNRLDTLHWHNNSKQLRP